MTTLAPHSLAGIEELLQPGSPVRASEPFATEVGALGIVCEVRGKVALVDWPKASREVPLSTIELRLDSKTGRAHAAKYLQARRSIWHAQAVASLGPSRIRLLLLDARWFRRMDEDGIECLRELVLMAAKAAP